MATGGFWPPQEIDRSRANGGFPASGLIGQAHHEGERDIEPSQIAFLESPNTTTYSPSANGDRFIGHHLRRQTQSISRAKIMEVLYDAFCALRVPKARGTTASGKSTRQC
jgi:hypothetical protein